MENKEVLKDYVCLMPFLYTDVQQASQFVCCPSWCFKSLRVDEKGEEEDWLNYFDTTADVGRNWISKPAFEIRKSMLDGSYRHCNHVVCPRLNGLINGSKLTPYMFMKKEEFQKTFNIYSEEDIKKFDTPPEEILFGFDRSCNLKCPSCRVHLIPNDDVESEDYANKLHLLNSIEKNFAHGLKRIMITGSGDPFYSKIYRDYLINFDVTKYPKLEALQIITNGNLLNEKMWNTMKATPHIKIIEISIDAGTKDTYENKTRLNGKWDVLMENLKFLSTQDHIIEEFVVSMVVSKHNYKEMYTFYQLITDIFKYSKFKWGLSINYRQIVDWGTYTKEDLTELQVFNPDNRFFDDFIGYLMEIHEKKYVNHNFHHLL
jgi:sulfatase maturation enzyme AslB (radical SAM superfamily)